MLLDFLVGNAKVLHLHKELVMQQYTDWLKTYFSCESLSSDIEEMNYFQAGLIDSFGVIELIESIESEFNIKLTELNFQERRFSTIKGLAEIIHEIKQEERKTIA